MRPSLKGSIGLPDLHSGYGFAIGNVAAFDMDDPEAVVSPGTVTFLPGLPGRLTTRFNPFVLGTN